MLIHLSIRDIVLIDRLDLDFGAGLTALTGETGAGKSILLDALGLAWGARGDGSLVRAGEKQGQVTAVFDLPLDHNARRLAAEQDIAIDGDLILRRVQLPDGRTRAFVNDQPVGAQILRLMAGQLIEIHGQHDERTLTESAGHRFLIDAYGRLGACASEVRNAWADWRDAIALAEAEDVRLTELRREADFLRAAQVELAKLAVGVGEEEELAQARATMMQNEKVASDLREVYESVVGDGSPMPGLAGALRRLQRRQGQAPALIEPALVALDETLVALERAQSVIETMVREANYDPQLLEKTEERLFAIRAAMRKFAAPADGLSALGDQYASDLAALDADEAKLTELGSRIVQLEGDYFHSAERLSLSRQAAARELDKAVNAEMPPLKLERAQFMTAIDSAPAQAGPEGIDRVEFWVSTNPGTKPGPLMKIASGGELSRFMLALKVALADRGSAPTLVFDEIDSGVGGAVADAIGQRLARLAETVQVLCVTHAPQVAARAVRHFHIAKGEVLGEERVATRVCILGKQERREEIARMLSGATITQEARAAARRLLAGEVQAE